MAQRSLQWEDRSVIASRHSNASDHSYRSYSTAPTEYSPRPAAQHFDGYYSKVDEYNKTTPHCDPHASVETYASTTFSEEEYGDEDEDELPDHDDGLEFSVPTYFPDEYAPDAIPATPRDFASLFPTTEKLSITHDDTTTDGNMNLRLHTNVTLRSGRVRNVTLFHLRMYDLRNREFSLRRYSRDSGREVCHTVRKYQKPAVEKRSGFQSFSSALAIVSGQRTATGHQRRSSLSKQIRGAGIQRSDSGYGSVYSSKAYGQTAYHQAAYRENNDRPVQHRRVSVQLPTNTVKLEFSNYAHLDIKRRGSRHHKRYEFEYWGTSYRWARTSIQRGKITEISYHLLQGGSEIPIAHIVPVPLTDAEAFEEDDKGGWIPPCSMWMSRVLEDDLADIVVASGLITLVDDNIKRRFHQNNKSSTFTSSARLLQIPLPIKNNYGVPLRMECVGPRRLFADVFGR